MTPKAAIQVLVFHRLYWPTLLVGYGRWRRIPSSGRIVGYRPSVIAPTMQALIARVHELDREALRTVLLRADDEYDEFS